MSRQLTELAQFDRDAFDREYDNEGCTCFISPPCGWCVHPGNPHNQEDDEFFVNQVLRLHLKRTYFDDIKAKTKPFEFRLMTPYWTKRLVGREYDAIEVMAGYPARDNADDRLQRPWRGYEAQTITHPHFGPDPVQVFAIRVN